MVRFLVLAACAVLAACGSLPKHAEVRTDEAPTIRVVGAPVGSHVMVDGTLVSVTEARTHKRPIPVSGGNHRVQVVLGQQVLYDREVFIQPGTERQIKIDQ